MDIFFIDMKDTNLSQITHTIRVLMTVLLE